MVILGWGWVGWGGAMTFMSTCPHTSCYVIVMFSCTCTCTHTSCYVMVIFSCTCSHTSCYVMVIFSCTCSHTSCYAMVVFSCTCTHTHTSCYVMVVLGWGWVGWGGAMTFMSTCTHTHKSCYVIVMFSCTCTHTSCYVMVIFSCTCSHTSCYAMVIFSCTCTHTSCAPLFLQMETVLGSHMPKVWKSNMPKCLIKTKNGPNKCEEPPFFPVHCGRDANRWQMVERPFQDGCMMESTQMNTLNWKSFCWRKSLGPLTPHRFLEELCKAVKAMKRFWEEGKKCCIPKKHELMSKNEVVLEICKTLVFTSTWEKMTFRCSENDIFVDEKLLKSYGRLWVGNQVVITNKGP